MAMEYFLGYFTYLDFMSELGDAECGRLFKACLTYGKSGAESELRGNERFIWPAMRAQIDRDKKKYLEKCEKNKANRNAETNVDDRGRTSTTVNERQRTCTKEKEKEKEKKKEKIISPPVSPSLGDTGFGEELKAAFEDWIAYKRERREAYKPTGLKSLVSEIRNNAAAYGEHEVACLIRECMAAGWRGVIFDRLKTRQRGGKQTAGNLYSDLESNIIRQFGGQT